MTLIFEGELKSAGRNEEIRRSFFKNYEDDNVYLICPAFLDVHVHLREPGFSYKETIHSGTLAAAKGGYSDVCSMPNLNPVPDSLYNLFCQSRIIEKDAVVNVHPYAALTVGEKGERLSDLAALARYCIAFSDDGRGVQNGELMFRAMHEAKRLDKLICAHCENDAMRNGGYINECEYSRRYGYPGINNESEWSQIERDIYLAKKTGVKYHVCHVSTKESVELIRNAKRYGVDISAETAPHYLVLDDSALSNDGRYKMNPPLRAKEDREALLEGIIDGTIDMIATDHAPHSNEEKAGGLKNSLMGIVGLETAFPVLYTRLVKTEKISLSRLVALMTKNPRERFSLPLTDDFCIYNLSEKFTVNPDEFLSKGKSTPFSGEELYGVCCLTVVGGRTVWQRR